MRVFGFRDVLISLLSLVISGTIAAQENSGAARYEIGSIEFNDIWVDPVNGDDSNTGLSRAQALRNVSTAWSRIPQGRNLTSAVRIMLMRGAYAVDSLPNYWESRHGTAQFPILLQGADGPGAAIFRGGVNLFDLRYVYMIDFDIIPTHGGDAWHCEKCDHMLVRNARLSGFDGARRVAQETVKANQSSNIFFEDNDIGGAYDNAVDFVGVQSGHFLGNFIHDADDWCHYLKGGSANFLVEGNHYANCGTGGFTAGQGSGFEFMQAPWLHYEAYDIKFLNNVIQDTEGAGIGINGGYNILIAHNTMYRVGSRSHGIEVVFGLRGCDGNTATCSANRAAGGWGGSGRDEEPIPNRNVFIYNNILYNPAGFRSAYEHFAIYQARTPSTGTNIPNPATTDTNLQIRGNLIWNGPADLPLGIGGSDRGCADSNPTCNQAQLLVENSINIIEPQLRDPSNGDFRPLDSGNVFSVSALAIPSFSGGDQPSTPAVPIGNLVNFVGFDRGAVARVSSVVGAYVGAESPLGDRPGSTPGGGDNGGGSQGAPTLTQIKVGARRVRNSVVISLRANIEDSDGVSSATVSVLDQRGNTLGSSSLQARTGSLYQGKLTLRKAGRLKRVGVTISAIDLTGASGSAQKRLKIKG